MVSAKTAYLIEILVATVGVSLIFTPFAGLCVMAVGLVTAGARG